MYSVLCSRARMVTYLPGLHPSVRRGAAARAFSAAGSSSGSDEPHVSPIPPKTVWPDRAMGPFGLLDLRFRLPGDVGFDCHLEGIAERKKNSSAHRMIPDLLSAPSNSERHGLVLYHLSVEIQREEIPASQQTINRAERYFGNSNVECAIQSCPELLKEEFELKFPEASFSEMLVVTVTQKAQNDTAARTEDVDKEREEMLDRFIAGAKEICYALHAEGFWADFIDPSSGLAFFGSHTNNTPLETGDRYRHLGFRIEDLGFCKVIRHALCRGTRVFVGTMFTDAPANSVWLRIKGSVTQ